MQIRNNVCCVMNALIVSFVCGSAVAQTSIGSILNQEETKPGVYRSFSTKGQAALIGKGGSVSSICTASDQGSKDIVAQARQISENELRDVDKKIADVEERIQRREQASEDIKKMNEGLAPDREELAKMGSYGVAKGVSQILESGSDLLMDVLGKGNRVMEAGYTAAKYAAKVIDDTAQVDKKESAATLALLTSKLDVPYKVFPGGYAMGVDLDAFPIARKVGNIADKAMSLMGFKDGVDSIKQGLQDQRDAAGLLAREAKMTSDFEYKMYQGQLRDQAELDALKSERDVIQARREKLVDCGLRAPETEGPQASVPQAKPVVEDAPSSRRGDTNANSRIEEMAKLEKALSGLKGDNPVLVASLRDSVSGGASIREVGPNRYRLEYPDNKGSLKVESPVMDFDMMNNFSGGPKSTEGQQMLDNMDQALSRWKQSARRHVGSDQRFRNRPQNNITKGAPQLTAEFGKFETLARQALQVINDMNGDLRNGSDSAIAAKMAKLESLSAQMRSLDPTKFVSNPTEQNMLDMEDRISWMQNAMDRMRSANANRGGFMAETREYKDLVNWMAATTPDENKAGVERVRSDFEKKSDSLAEEYYRKRSSESQAFIRMSEAQIDKIRNSNSENAAERIQRFQSDIDAVRQSQSEYDEQYNKYWR